MANVATITISVLAETARFTAGLKKSRNEANKFAKNVKRALTTVVTISTVTIGALALLGRASIKTADNIGKTAKAVGLSAETLQELRFAAAQTGVEVRGLDDSVKRFNRRVGEFATSGGGPAALAIKTLGIEIRDTNGAVRSSEAIFIDTVDAMSKMESQAQRAAIAAQLFGDDFGPKLTPLLDQGVDGIARLREEARSLGIVLSNETVAAAERAEDTFNRLDALIRGQVTKAFAENADAIADATEAMIAFVVESFKAFNALRKFFGVETEEETLRERIASLTDRIRESRQLINQGQVSLAARGPSPLFTGALGIGRGDIAAIGAGAAGATARVAKLEDELTETVDRLKELVKLKNAFTDLNIPASTRTASGIGGTTANALKEQLARIKSIKQSLEKPIEGLLRFRDELDELTGPGLLSATEAMELFGRKAQSVFEGMVKPVKVVTTEMQQQWKQAINNMQDTLAEFLVGGFEEGMRGMLKAFTETLKRMVANLIASKILTFFFGLFKSPVAVPTGGGGGSAGASAQLGGFRRGRAFVAGERGPELVSPGSGSTVTPIGLGQIFIEQNISGLGLSAEELVPVLNENNRQIKAELLDEISRGAFT